LRLEETKKWGQSTLIPNSHQQNLKLGSEYNIALTLFKTKKCTLTPIFKRQIKKRTVWYEHGNTKQLGR